MIAKLTRHDEKQCTAFTECNSAIHVIFAISSNYFPKYHKAGLHY